MPGVHTCFFLYRKFLVEWDLPSSLSLTDAVAITFYLIKKKKKVKAKSKLLGVLSLEKDV